MARSLVPDNSTQVLGYSSDPNEAGTLFNGIPMQDDAYLFQGTPEYGMPPAPIGSTIPPVAYEKEPAPQPPTDPQTNPPAENDPATSDGHGSCDCSCGTQQKITETWFALYKYNDPPDDTDKSDDIFVGYMKMTIYDDNFLAQTLTIYDENMEPIDLADFPLDYYDYVIDLFTTDTGVGELVLPESILDKPAAKNQIPEIAAKATEKRTQLELIEEAVKSMPNNGFTDFDPVYQKYFDLMEAQSTKIDEIRGKSNNRNHNYGPLYDPDDLEFNGVLRAGDNKSQGFNATQYELLPLAQAFVKLGEVIILLQPAPPLTGGAGRSARGMLRGSSRGALRKLDIAAEKAQKANLCAIDSTKMGGRLGNESTRLHVADVAGELERRGFEITGGGGRFPEEYIPGFGGIRKGSAYPDITAIKNGRTIRINTVDTLVDGYTLSRREALNAARIRRLRPFDHLITIPKPK